TVQDMELSRTCHMPRSKEAYHCPGRNQYHGASREAPWSPERSINDAETLRTLGATGRGSAMCRSALQGKGSHDMDDGHGAGVDRRCGTAGQLRHSAGLPRG